MNFVVVQTSQIPCEEVGKYVKAAKKDLFREDFGELFNNN